MFLSCIPEGFPKIQNLEFIKEKIDRFFRTKIINVCMTKDSINKVKRQVKKYWHSRIIIFWYNKWFFSAFPLYLPSIPPPPTPPAAPPHLGSNKDVLYFLPQRVQHNAENKGVPSQFLDFKRLGRGIENYLEKCICNHLGLEIWLSSFSINILDRDFGKKRSWNGCKEKWETSWLEKEILPQPQPQAELVSQEQCVWGRGGDDGVGSDRKLRNRESHISFSLKWSPEAIRPHVPSLEPIPMW